MKASHNIDLKPYNTFGLSAIAERLVQVESKADLEAYFLSKQAQPSLVLGGGSNMLLTKDIAGTVLKIEIPGFELVREDEEAVYIKVGAGEAWHDFVLKCIAQGWAGVENLSLIPGNVGTAPMQNIGAYGVEIKDVFHELEAYLTNDHCFQAFGLEDCQFGYRESVFKRKLKNQAVIASVTFKLKKQPTFNTSYGAIEAELERMGVKDLSIKAVSDAVIAIRQSKLPDPKKIGNSGSFFKNPEIETSVFQQLQNHFPNIVGYKVNETSTKLAAGWLIEQAGFKGKNYGNYGVHNKQALVLVNYGGANGQQVFELSEEIIEAVNAKYGIKLEREVNVV
jgi:UDP-N-acetylmuramate dehydrogenase